MSAPISSILPVTLPEMPKLGSTAAPAGGFQSVLESVVNGVEQSQAKSQQAVDSFLTGGNDDLHSVALASQRSQLEFDLFLQVRNKVVQAYQEVMRMQL
ncbi:MAG: flagellar hook-basal body complex protein FliE [Acidobacteriia bacterium]|nr:flagellar hook-basal body complex protein FliE [Terriglobia bacterium]